ncbi:MAG TPA: twin-arginine translocase TatA/TatE family subunit [Acidimicrobiia bacterium]
MFQGGELIIIMIVALIVLGPARLPEIARKAGEYAAELRKAAREIQRGLESEVAGLKEVSDEWKGIKDDFKKPLGDIKKAADEVGVSRLEWTGPKPVSGPTPADAMADLEEIERREALQSREPGGDEEE